MILNDSNIINYVYEPIGCEVNTYIIKENDTSLIPFKKYIIKKENFRKDFIKYLEELGYQNIGYLLNNEEVLIKRLEK